MFGCSMDDLSGMVEADGPHGLKRGHAYSMTAAKLMEHGNGESLLLRVRDPHGDSSKWTGAWSDNSVEWSLISNEMKPKFEPNGEFFISFDDFMKCFDDMEVCYILRRNEGWRSSQFDGEWTAGINAGGCRSNFE